MKIGSNGKKAMLLCIGIFLIGCNSNSLQRGNPAEERISHKIQQVEAIQGFSTINGYKVQEGKFFFTGVKDNEWDFYCLDIASGEIKSIHQEAENYDLYIALGEKGAVYVDLDGKLYYRNGDIEKKVDENIIGVHRPNLLISPNQNAVLYTKGLREKADLYLYFFDKEEPQLIKKNISEEAFKNFSFTTQWSNKTNYFIYNNEEVYNNKGQLHCKIKATTAKWSPDDVYIVFIKRPDELEENSIYIGDWNTYIGKELMVLRIEDKKEEKIYENPKGLIDPIDSIKWSKNASKVGISVGDIEKASHGELESIKYNKIFIYDLETGEAMEVEDMPYNYYEILFNNYLYGSSLGKRDVLEIVALEDRVRKRYDTPVLLNSKDMFLISYNEVGYFLDGKRLLKITSNGETEEMTVFPWEVNEIYLDPVTDNLIITNKNMEMYLMKL